VKLAEEVRKRWPRVPVVYMSGMSEEEARESHGVPEGADFIPKPFDVDALRAAVRRALDYRASD
jgi:DNA-binding response OmpR family regulator